MFKNSLYKKMKTFSVISLLSIMIISGGAFTAFAAELPGEGTTVKPGRATWSTGFFLEALYSRALEHLGYQVKDPKKLSCPIFYQSLSNGDLDFWANGWFPAQRANLPDNFEEKGSICGTIVDNGAVQGYLASKDEVEKYNITTIEDFKRPEVKKAFDANGDGKADLVACPPGWGCTDTIAFHMKAYDMKEHVNLIKAGYAAGMADAVSRYNAGGPVFFYTWTPNWTVNKLKPGKDVMWIGVPEIIPRPAQKEMEDALIQSGLEGAVSDPLKMGWVANDINVVANNEFLENNPAAAKIFKIMSVPMEDISAQNKLMYEGEDDQEDIERHATEWIKEHQFQWDKWQRMARKAAR